MKKGEFVEQGCHWWQTINDKGKIKIDDMERIDKCRLKGHDSLGIEAINNKWVINIDEMAWNGKLEDQVD